MPENGETARDIPVSARTGAILATIEDADLRAQVDGVVRRALAALADFGRIHLPQDHFEEGATTRPPGDKHLELAPYVLAAIASTNELLRYVAQSFAQPASAPAQQSDDDFDLEFDLVDGPTGDGVGLSHRAGPESALGVEEQVCDAVHAFSGMLHNRVRQLAGRLRFALESDDSWPLLAELDDALHGLTKALQGVLFGVLSVFAAEVRREEIYPEYRSAVTEGVALRLAVTELSYHIGRFNAALAEASKEAAVPLVVAVADRLGRFSAGPEYRTLRAEDKKAVIDFRATLHSLRHRQEGLAMLPLRHAVEGFSKFLEAMSAINHREVLVLHDQRRLREILERVDTALARAADDPNVAADSVAGIVIDLESVAGRNPELDQLRRDAAASLPGPTEVVTVLHRWRAALSMTLAAVA